MIGLTARMRFTGTNCTPAFARLTIKSLILVLLFLPAACGSPVETPADEGANIESANVNTASAPTNSTPTPAVMAAAAAEVAPLEPLDEEQSQPPVHIQIPAIDLEAEVEEMGWQIVMVDGERTTRWVLPENGLGWHANSAGVGAAGNTILSGRQIGADAPLVALALGDIQVDQEVYLTDQDGLTFVYRIVEISDPIPAAGATEEELEQATTYLAPADTPRLTLATGWPEFTTTHRIFAVGELEGVVR